MFGHKKSKLALFFQSRYKHRLYTSVNEGKILSFLQLLNALGDRGREEECLTRLWQKFQYLTQWFLKGLCQQLVLRCFLCPLGESELGNFDQTTADWRLLRMI